VNWYAAWTNDKIVYANGSWKDKIGFVEKETLSLKIWDLIHPAHIEKCKVYFEKMKSGERPDPKTAGIETVFISTGNKPVTARLNNSSIIRDSNGDSLIMCSFRDISSKKEAEEKISS
jgi:PAS domain S-box